MAHSDVNILNVGAGSCVVVQSPSGRASMIDINDGGDLREAAGLTSVQRAVRAASLGEARAKIVDPIAFCTANGIPSLFRFVLSHPDADHMAGLRRVLGGELPTLNFWDIPHHRTRNDPSEFQTAEAYQDWLAYESLRNRTMSNPPVLLNPLRADSGHYWIDDDIEILSPTRALVDDCDASDAYNNASYILRVRHGQSSVLLPGDVEDKGWNDMIAAGIDLSADVLVASHHGRKSGYSDAAMAAINPSVVIISTGRLDPAVDAEAEYRKWTRNVYSTRYHGTLWIRMQDDGSFEVWNHDGEIAGFVRTRAA